MRQLPNISGTVANWSLNGTLVDSSGNGLTLTSLDATFETPMAPTYVTFDGCTGGVDTTYASGVGNPGNFSKLKLSAAQTSLLRFTGPFTFQWIMVQTVTFTISHFDCCNPDNINPHRDGSPDRIGSLYNISSSTSTSGGATITDQNIGSNLPSANYGNAATNANWGHVPASAPPFAAPAAFCVTRDSSGNYHFYRAGVLVGTVLSAGGHTASGVECFYIGGTESGIPITGAFGNSGGAQYANVRVLNYERQPVDVLADANFMAAPCANREPFVSGATGTIAPLTGAAATGHHFRYVPKAFGDQFRNPGEGS